MPAPQSSPRTRLILCALIFLFAFGVRVLSWHDTRLEVGKVQTVVAGDYKRVAQLLREGGMRSFFSRSSPLADLNHLGHPPGYSILVALVQTLFGSSDTAVQFVQITADSLAAVAIFLIVVELLSLSAAIITGVFAAFSPQFAWNSVLLLPDSLAVLPILVAIYLVIRATKNPRVFTFLMVGALIGISCWLRANALLLTFFAAAAVPLLIKNGRRWHYAGAVLCGTFLIIAPLTLRNAIVFHRFIPLSLGAGQTFLEGIGDYDTEGRFGVPNTDMGIMKQEAETYNRPDYYGTLFNPDGVERERARLSRGLAVVRAHPLWFAGVMARRATSMMRLERSRLVSTYPPVSQSLSETAARQPIRSLKPGELLAAGAPSTAQTHASVITESEPMLTISSSGSNYGDQFAAPIENVKKDFDYVLIVPAKISAGRMKISVKSMSGAAYSSFILEPLETVSAENQPLNDMQLPFVAGATERVQVVLSNETSNAPHPLVRVGTVRLYELGPARFLWTRLPRFLVNTFQKVFLTAVILPFAIIGLLVLIFQRNNRALVVLSIVPVYYFCVQSIVHTEYRYILAVYYFLFALAGFGLASLAAVTQRQLRRAVAN